LAIGLSAIDYWLFAQRFGVPLYEFRGKRSQRKEWVERKGEASLAAYRHAKNSHSIDGLPGATYSSTVATIEGNQNLTQRRKGKTDFEQELTEVTESSVSSLSSCVKILSLCPL
jgi:hypothetical protein